MRLVGLPESETIVQSWIKEFLLSLRGKRKANEVIT